MLAKYGTNTQEEFGISERIISWREREREKWICVRSLNWIGLSGWITLLTKVHLVKAMVFPVVMYGCESWTIKKAEHWRIDAFELWYWRRLKVLWTAKRSNQSILKEISPEYSLEGLMLKLRLQYFGHPMWRTDLFEKNLRLGKIKHRRVWQRMRWLDGITNLMDMSLSKLQELVMNRSLACCSLWDHKELDTTERLNCTVTIVELISDSSVTQWNGDGMAICCVCPFCKSVWYRRYFKG